MPKWFPKKPTAGEYLPDFHEADAGALQALQRGDATPDQQKRALKWIIEQASGMYEDPFDKTSARFTDYNIGRASVGRMIVTLLNFSQMEVLKRKR